MGYKFQFKVNDNLLFEGDLICSQCIEIKKDGNRCKRKTCIGVPVCHQHLESKYKLKIKKSSIPNAGKGLFVFDKFAENDIIFKKGDKIISYEGELINLQQLNKRYGDYTAPYALNIDKNNYRDASLKRGVGSLGNTNNKRNNVKLSANTKNKTAFLKATKNIRNGSEIFISYVDLMNQHHLKLIIVS